MIWIIEKSIYKLGSATQLNIEIKLFYHKKFILMLISMFTGMRMGEVNALTINDINTKFNFINVDKTITRKEHGRALISNIMNNLKSNMRIRQFWFMTQNAVLLPSLN